MKRTSSNKYQTRGVDGWMVMAIKVNRLGVENVNCFKLLDIVPSPSMSTSEADLSRIIKPTDHVIV